MGHGHVGSAERQAGSPPTWARNHASPRCPSCCWSFSSSTSSCEACPGADELVIKNQRYVVVLASNGNLPKGGPLAVPMYAVARHNTGVGESTYDDSSARYARWQQYSVATQGAATCLHSKRLVDVHQGERHRSSRGRCIAIFRSTGAGVAGRWLLRGTVNTPAPCTARQRASQRESWTRANGAKWQDCSM